MKLIMSPKPIFLDLDNLLDSVKDLGDDPVWVYADKLFDDYLDRNDPRLKEWIHRDNIECLSCELEDRKLGPDDVSLGCTSCWNKECEMMELSEKFYKQAKSTIHLLTENEISTMIKEYADKREAYNEKYDDEDEFE